MSGTMKKFDTTGILIGSIVGLVSGGWGLTYGNGYLWVSNPDENMIYKIGFGDGSPPAMEAILEPKGQYYNVAPSFSNFGFDDNIGLDDGWYQLDSYTGTWASLFVDVEGTEWNDDGWTLPEFDALGEGSHTIYFKASDDAGNTEGESGEWSWQFYKDVTPPVAFSLIAPANYAWVNVTRPTFRWHTAGDQLSGISNYKIYIDETLRDSSTDTVWIPNFDLYEGFHDWHVAAYDSAGNYHSSEEVFTFGIDTTQPILDGTTMWADTGFRGPYYITTNVSETRSEVDSVLLYYRFDGGEWQSTAMDFICDIQYGAEIPEAPNTSTTISYYVKAQDLANNVAFDPEDAPGSFYSFIGWVGIAERSVENAIPINFALLQNYPNPFGYRTSIQYAVASSQRKDKNLTTDYCLQTTLKIYDLTGRLVRTLLNKPQQPGYYEVSWDGLDDSGGRVINGVYVCRMIVCSAGGGGVNFHVETKKMIVLGH